MNMKGEQNFNDISKQALSNYGFQFLLNSLFFRPFFHVQAVLEKLLNAVYFLFNYFTEFNGIFLLFFFYEVAN